MNKLLQFLLRRHRPDLPALSAYADGRLGATESRALEAHLATCAACQAELAGLRAVRDALRALPQVDQPRSFRLRATDVERAPARPSAGGLGRAMRLAPALSAAAVLVFVIAVGADLARGGSHGAQLASSSASRAGDEAAAAAPSRPMQSPAAAFGSITNDSGGTVAGAPAAGIGAPPAPTAAAGDIAPESQAPAPMLPATTDVPTAAVASDAAATPPPATAPAVKAAVPAPTRELSATAERQSTSGGGVDGLRITEIIAAAVALIAAAAAIGWRLRRGAPE